MMADAGVVLETYPFKGPGMYALHMDFLRPVDILCSTKFLTRSAMVCSAVDYPTLGYERDCIASERHN